MKPIIRAVEHNLHPGEILFYDIIEPNHLTIDKTASLLGITRSNLSNIVNGKTAISPLMAIRISRVFGGNASLWINLQSKYDLSKAEREFEEKQINLERFEHAY